MEDNNPTSPIARPYLAASMMAGVLLVLLAWYFLVLRQDYAILYSELRPEEAAAVVEALEKQNVPYRLGAGGSEIRVPSSRLDNTRIGLASSDVALGGVDGFELFNESDMGLTDFAQKIRYQRALQGELARTIRRMEGVAEARVHISMPERTLFRGERRNAEAAVTLIMRRSEDETPARIDGVQRLVAAAVPDLLVSDVVVLNARGEVISPRIEIGDAGVRARAGATAEAAPPIDFVMDVMHTALPNTRFEVTIENLPGTLAGAVDGEFQPTQRLVTVLTEDRLSNADAERVGMALRRAGIVDGQSGGTLALRVGPPTLFETLHESAQRGRVEASSSAPRGRTFTLAPWFTGLAALALIAAAAAGLWAWRARPALQRDEHERFADHLKALMDKHAEPQDA